MLVSLLKHVPADELSICSNSVARQRRRGQAHMLLRDMRGVMQYNIVLVRMQLSTVYLLI